MRNVAIVGSAQSGYVRRNREESTQELIYRVTKKALESTGLARDDIDTVVIGSCDMLDGISISNVFSVDPSGAFLKDESKVEEDAGFAAFYAYLRLLSGAFDTALVVGWGKGSEGSIPHYTGLIFEPFYQRPLGLEAISATALQARAYMDKYGVTEEQAARVVVKNRRQARANPYAQHHSEIDTQRVLNSPVLASPIKTLDCPPISDGACAVIMAADERAQEITSQPAWIRGVGSCTDAYHLGYRDLSKLKACSIAAKKAYQMAAISNPLKEIDVAEVSEIFSFGELILYEALGFCGPGEGGKFMEDGLTEMGGELPVNPSGGALNANPTPATGLVRVAEAALQISGKAGERQVKGADVALAHATSGICFQANVVFILGGEPL